MSEFALETSPKITLGEDASILFQVSITPLPLPLYLNHHVQMCYDVFITCNMEDLLSKVVCSKKCGYSVADTFSGVEWGHSIGARCEKFKEDQPI